MTQNNNPAIGNFTLKTPITHKAVQYTGDDSLPAIRELLESIGYEPDVVEQVEKERIKIPAIDIEYYTEEGENEALARVGDVIVIGHEAGFPGTATITVLGKEQFEKLFDKEV